MACLHYLSFDMELNCFTFAAENAYIDHQEFLQGLGTFDTKGNAFKYHYKFINLRFIIPRPKKQYLEAFKKKLTKAYFISSLVVLLYKSGSIEKQICFL